MDGALPVHMACGLSRYKQTGYTMDYAMKTQVIAFLIDHSPEVLNVANGQGMLPLHLVCHDQDLPIKILDILLSRCPGALSVTDNTGYLTLRHACTAGCKVDIIRRLLEADGSFVLQETNGGYMPLVLAYCHLNRCRHRRRWLESSPPAENGDRLLQSAKRRVREAKALLAVVKEEQQRAIQDKKNAFLLVKWDLYCWKQD